MTLGGTCLGQNHDNAWEGPYQPVPDHMPGVGQADCCELAHAILIGRPGEAQGKVLVIEGNGTRWLWNPAAPNSVSGETKCDTVVDDIMFCAGHSADGDGNIVLIGGTRLPNANGSCCTPQPQFSYVYYPDILCWSGNFPLFVPNLSPPLPANWQNVGFYYPGSLRLPNGWLISVGGGSSPLDPITCCDTGGVYFVDGWQIFDPTIPGWHGYSSTQWYGGLSGSYLLGGTGPSVDFDFNYYPLLMLMPTSAASATGYAFAPVVTDNRNANSDTNPGYLPRRSPSAKLVFGPGLPTGATWMVHQSQINVPNSTTPRNLLYPNGFLWPLHLDASGQPTNERRFVVLGGGDENEYLTGTIASPGTPTTVHPHGGRPASRDVYSIDYPELPTSAWTTTLLPQLTFERIFSNTVILPTEQVFVVGGSSFNFLPFAGQSWTNLWERERIAEPVFCAEMIDLTNPTGWAWVVCPAHVSPRLYHSFALLLPDGRVLVGGGYRGMKPNPPHLAPYSPEELTWLNWQHSDFEIFSPDYLFAGARPQIKTVTGPSGANTITYGQSFEISMALPGASIPNQAIGSVCLISPGSLTHHYDWDQRYVRLTSIQMGGSATKLTVHAPANGFVAPPGMYMLFINSDPAATNGVKIPSIAAFVKLQY